MVRKALEDLAESVLDIGPTEEEMDRFKERALEDYDPEDGSYGSRGKIAADDDQEAPPITSRRGFARTVFYLAAGSSVPAGVEAGKALANSDSLRPEEAETVENIEIDEDSHYKTAIEELNPNEIVIDPSQNAFYAVTDEKVVSASADRVSSQQEYDVPIARRDDFGDSRRNHFSVGKVPEDGVYSIEVKLESGETYTETVKFD